MAKPTDLPEWDTTEVNSIEPDADHKDQGWLAPGGIPEKPPFQTFNHWQNNVYKWMKYLNDRGITAWDALSEYEIGAYVVGSDGEIYKALTGADPSFNIGNDPVGDVVNWESYSSFIKDYSVTTSKIADDAVTAAKVEFNTHRKNLLINANPLINQREVSGTVVLAAGEYGHDRWRAGTGGCTYTFATSANVTTITISAGTLEQEIEGLSLQSGTHVLSWVGTSQGQVDGAGFGAPGVTSTLTGGTNAIVEFNTGTLSLVQLEEGSVATSFEQRHIGEELSLCQRYYEKSYLQTTTPGSADNSGSRTITTSGTHNIQNTTELSVGMRVPPTVTLYSPLTGVTGNIRDRALLADVVASATEVSGSSFSVQATFADQGWYYYQFTADAEL